MGRGIRQQPAAAPVGARRLAAVPARRHRRLTDDAVARRVADALEPFADPARAGLWQPDAVWAAMGAAAGLGRALRRDAAEPLRQRLTISVEYADYNDPGHGPALAGRWLEVANAAGLHDTARRTARTIARRHMLIRDSYPTRPRLEGQVNVARKLTGDRLMVSELVRSRGARRAHLRQPQRYGERQRTVCGKPVADRWETGTIGAYSFEDGPVCGACARLADQGALAVFAPLGDLTNSSGLVCGVIDTVATELRDRAPGDEQIRALVRRCGARRLAQLWASAARAGVTRLAADTVTLLGEPSAAAVDIDRFAVALEYALDVSDVPMHAWELSDWPALADVRRRLADGYRAVAAS